MKRRYSNLCKSDSRHCEMMLQSLMRSKGNGRFCDVLIKCGNVEIRAHRNVLAAASPYLENILITLKMDGTLPVVDLSDIPSEALKKCINFIYSGEVDHRGTNLQLLLKTAQNLQLDGMKKLCLSILVEKIRLENCLEVISLIHDQGEDALNTLIKWFLSSKVEDFIQLPDFVRLKLKELVYCLGLLQGGDRKVEIEKWNGVLKWVNFDLEARQKDFQKLFEMVDMTGFTKKCLQEILKNPLVERSCFCLKSVASIVTDESFGYASTNSSLGKKKMTHIISCKIGSQIIVKYNVTTKKWSRLTTFPGEFNHHCDIISHGDNIYIGTGNQIYAYVNGLWDTKVFRTTVTCQRCRSVYWHVGKKENIVECAGSVYLSSIEPQKVPVEIAEQVITCNKCNFGFMHASLLDVANSWCYPPTNSCYNRCIATDQEVYMVTSGCVLQYSTDTQQISCQTFQTGLGNAFFIAASHDRIFAMGGCLSGKRVVEYNFMTKQSCRLADMISEKPTGHAFWYMERLYALGGFFSAKLEVYNSQTNQWSSHPDVTIPQDTIKIFLGDGLFLVGKSWNVKRISLGKLKSLISEDGNNSDENTIICPAHLNPVFNPDIG